MSAPLTTLVVDRAAQPDRRTNGMVPFEWRADHIRQTPRGVYPSAQRYCANGALHRAAFVLTGEKDAGKACAHLTARSLTGIDERAAATRELVVLDDCYGHAAVPSMFDALLEQTSMAEQTSASVV